MIIAPELALLGWIALGFTLTAIWDGHKAFTWTFLGAMFFLPSNLDSSLQLPGLPPLEKATVIFYGMIPATLLFHLTRLKTLRWWDWFLIATVFSVYQTSVSNFLTAHDGRSNAFGHVATLVGIVYLLRVHIQTREHVLYFMRSLVWLGVAYSPLLLWEFRMSPQWHTDVYGYFPHQFFQMARWGFYRPLGFFPHALDCAYAFAIIVLVAAGLIMNRDKAIPRWTILPLIAALAASMSMGPIMFALAGYALMRVHLTRRIGPLRTIAPFVIIGVWLYFSDSRQNFEWMVNAASSISAERAESLLYRIEAFEIYIENIVNKPVFGHGTWGRGRIEGLATDSSLLIHLLAYGFVFVGCLYAWYWGQLRSMRLLTNPTLGHDAARRDHVGLACYWALWLCIVSNFFVEGTALTPLILCSAYAANTKKPPAEEPEAAPDDPVASDEQIQSEDLLVLDPT